MKEGYLTLLSALFISSVAIYFSVAGLAAIFSAYAISIIVMGTAIELGKLVGVVWLHNHWHTAKSYIKYLFVIVITGVMLITSGGIFGYLSKSHIEQTSATSESTAQVQRVTNEIARNRGTIIRSEEKIQKYENNGSGVDASLQTQIDKEQKRIDSSYDRVKPVIQTQLQIIKDARANAEERTTEFRKELTAINRTLTDLQEALNSGQIRKAQSIIGTKPDGSYRSRTVKAMDKFRTRKESRRDWLLKKIDDILSRPSLAQLEAQQEIKRIRNTAQIEIDESNATIKRLRERLGKTSANNVESLISIEQAKIKTANTELDTLIQKKFEMEANKRKLVAEVGPLKYIAEFAYNKKADDAMLEKAVQWVIILIIFVFDPFAVLLLIAAQHSFNQHKKLRVTKVKTKDYNPEETMWEGEPDPYDYGSSTVSTENRPAWKFFVDKDLDKPKTPEEIDPEDSDYFKWREPEPEVPENIDVPEHEIEPVIEPEIEEPAVINFAVDDNNYLRFNQISLTRVGEHYINYNGKNYRIEALKSAFPELNLDFSKEVKSGTAFPNAEQVGMMFIQVEEEPTQLYIFNGSGWNKIDKNLLEYEAYSREYIKVLIKRIGSSNYNTELLNALEKRHIEDILTQK